MLAEEWSSRLKLEFKIIKAKAAYAMRSDRKKRGPLVDFLIDGIDKVDSIDQFSAFVRYFEAAVGFAYL